MVSRLTDVERSSVGNEFDAHNRGRHAETPCSQLRPRSKNYKCALTCNSFRQDKTAAVVVSEFSVRDVSCSDAARMRTVAVSTVPFVCVESTVAALHTYRFPPSFRCAQYTPPTRQSRRRRRCVFGFILISTSVTSTLASFSGIHCGN